MNVSTWPDIHTSSLDANTKTTNKNNRKLEKKNMNKKRRLRSKEAAPLCESSEEEPLEEISVSNPLLRNYRKRDGRDGAQDNFYYTDRE